MKSKTPFTLLAIAAAVLLLTGAASARAADVFTAILNGSSESLPNASPGTGFARITFDLSAHTMEVQVNFSGLLGTTTASHIHAATASPGTGVAPVATMAPAFAGFPLGVTSGTYDHTFNTLDPSFYLPAYLAAHGGTAVGAEAALDASLLAGTSYFNIHTSVVPGGEIRGFLNAVPEPFSTFWAALPIAGMLGVAGLRSRKAQA